VSITTSKRPGLRRWAVAAGKTAIRIGTGLLQIGGAVPAPVTPRPVAPRAPALRTPTLPASFGTARVYAIENPAKGLVYVGRSRTKTYLTNTFSGLKGGTLPINAALKADIAAQGWGTFTPRHWSVPAGTEDAARTQLLQDYANLGWKTYNVNRTSTIKAPRRKARQVRATVAAKAPAPASAPRVVAPTVAPATTPVPQAVRDCAREITQLLRARGGAILTTELDRARLGLGYDETTWRAGKDLALGNQYRVVGKRPSGKSIWEAFL
jgi:hypothetical protein